MTSRLHTIIEHAALTCAKMAVPDVTGWKYATVCMTVTMLMTMLADNAEDIRILRSRLSFTLRKNQVGSALKSMSAIQSAVVFHDKR